MTTNSQVTDRYATAAPDGAMLRPKSNNVYVSRDGRTIYSYGSHFPMAIIMPAGGGCSCGNSQASVDAGHLSVSNTSHRQLPDNPRGWWLVNGDRYSVTTSRHQSDLRGALAKTGLPMLIV